jgi:membrane-associated phospholipid phosphatase
MRLMLAFVLWSTTVHAQPVALDRFTPPLPVEHRRTAEILSNVTLYTTVGIDAWQSWQAEDRTSAFVKQGVRVGLTEGIVYLTKRIAHRTRPCAPACGIDHADTSFPSGHTALAFASIGRRHVAFTVPMAAGTGALRVASGKHWATDIAAGALMGALSSFIR